MPKRESFEKLNAELIAKFGAELNQIPLLQKQLSEIAGIPGKLDKLIDRIEYSNSALASSVSGTMARTAKDITSISSHDGASLHAVSHMLSGWMRWTIVVSVILIALACVSNTVYNIWFTAENESSTIADFEGVDGRYSATGTQNDIDSTQIQVAKQASTMDTASLVPNSKAQSINHP